MVRQISSLRARFKLRKHASARGLGKLVQAVMLDTGEILYLYRQRDGYAIFLLGASALVPWIMLDDHLSTMQALYWMPQYALRLSQRWDGSSFPDPKRLTKQLKDWRLNPQSLTS